MVVAPIVVPLVLEAAAQCTKPGELDPGPMVHSYCLSTCGEQSIGLAIRAPVTCMRAWNYAVGDH
jgi:hypothetical protein